MQMNEICIHRLLCADKLSFHGADTDTDTDTDLLSDTIEPRELGSSRECRRAVERAIRITSEHRTSDVSARILTRMSVSVSVSASWNSSYSDCSIKTVWPCADRS